jgi:serine/threonine protein kinase
MFNSGFQLKIIEGPGYGRVIPLQVNEISLGRAQDAQQPSAPNAVFFMEGTVSRVHARLLWDDRNKVFKIQHLSKTNQTKVNEKVIQEHVLEFGDRIGLGKLVLEVQKAPKADHLRSDLLEVPPGLKAVVPGSPAPSRVPPPQFSDSLPGDMAGRRLGVYQIEKELGRGSVGRVYLAHHTTWNDHKYAIKILAPEVTRDASFVQRFQMEAKVASSLRHPNIIQVTDICLTDGLVYLVMECLSPRSLQTVIDETKGPFPIKRIVLILEQLLSALDHAHSNGIIHRDVKPGNILIDESRDSIALTDFSIAKVKDGIRLTSTGVLLGTVEYMAPELFEGHTADARADLYAVGVILYELLTGVPPFRGKTTAEVIKSQLLHLPAHPKTYNPNVPDWLVQMNFILLQKNPEHRFSSARDVRANLLEYSQTL